MLLIHPFGSLQTNYQNPPLDTEPHTGIKCSNYVVKLVCKGIIMFLFLENCKICSVNVSFMVLK